MFGRLSRPLLRAPEFHSDPESPPQAAADSEPRSPEPTRLLPKPPTELPPNSSFRLHFFGVTRHRTAPRGLAAGTPACAPIVNSATESSNIAELAASPMIAFVLGTHSGKYSQPVGCYRAQEGSLGVFRRIAAVREVGPQSSHLALCPGGVSSHPAPSPDLAADRRRSASDDSAGPRRARGTDQLKRRSV